MVEGDKSKESAINVEEKCDIDEEMPVEQPVDVAHVKNTMVTLISADGENDNNTGELFFYQCILLLFNSIYKNTIKYFNILCTIN